MLPGIEIGRRGSSSVVMTKRVDGAARRRRITATITTKSAVLLYVCFDALYPLAGSDPGGEAASALRQINLRSRVCEDTKHTANAVAAVLTDVSTQRFAAFSLLPALARD